MSSKRLNRNVQCPVRRQGRSERSIPSFLQFIISLMRQGPVRPRVINYAKLYNAIILTMSPPLSWNLFLLKTNVPRAYQWNDVASYYWLRIQKYCKEQTMYWRQWMDTPRKVYRKSRWIGCRSFWCPFFSNCNLSFEFIECFFLFGERRNWSFDNKAFQLISFQFAYLAAQHTNMLYSIIRLIVLCTWWRDDAHYTPRHTT